MSTKTSSTKPLTAGQQGVIQMYDKEIRFAQRMLNEVWAAFDAGKGSYDEVRYYRDQIEDLSKERRETLEWYATK